MQNNKSGQGEDLCGLSVFDLGCRGESVPTGPGSVAGKSDTWRWQLVSVGLLWLLTLIIFGNTFTNDGWVLDNSIIPEDTRLHELTRENLGLILKGDYWWVRGGGSGLYRPVATLTYLLNYSVLNNRDNAMGYHIVNWILHSLNATMVFFLVLSIWKRAGPAFFTAALFAAHPLNVESVTNIIGRADLLATLAILVGLFCHRRAMFAGGMGRIFWVTALAAVSIVGVFCKETGVLILPVLILYDLVFNMEKLRLQRIRSFFVNFGRLLWGYLPVLPALVAFAYVREKVFALYPLPVNQFLDNNMVGADFWTARLTAIKVVGKYLALMVWPANLAADYSFNQVPLVNWPFSGWEDWQALVALLVILVMLAFSIHYKRTMPALFFAVIWLFGTMLPTSNLLPRPGAPLLEPDTWLTGCIMAERFTYLPTIGFAGLLTVLACAAWKYCSVTWSASGSAGWKAVKWFAPFVPVLLLLAFGLRSHLRNYDWKDDLTLWSHDVKMAPNSFKTHLALGEAIYNSDPSGDKLDLVINEAEEALAISDQYEPLLINLGVYYRKKGDLLVGEEDFQVNRMAAEQTLWYSKSVEILKRAVKFDQTVINKEYRQRELGRGGDPGRIADVGNIESYYNLGVSLVRLGRHEEAVDAYRYMVHLAPFDPRPYQEMAAIYEDLQEHYQSALLLHQLMVLNNNNYAILERISGIYNQLGLQKCIVKNDHGQIELDYSCPEIHQNICAANLDLVEIFLGAKKIDTAWEILQGSMQVYGCSQENYQHLLPQK